MSVNVDDPGKRRAVALGLGAAIAAVALIGKGQVSAITVGALAGVLAAAKPAGASDTSLDADLRLAVVEGRVEQNEERIKRLLGLLEQSAPA